MAQRSGSRYSNNDRRVSPLPFETSPILPAVDSAQPAVPSNSQQQDRQAWEPFLMPNMDPFVRQQGLLFEQSELLREQFLRFGEGLQRLHGMIERLREELDVERKQRVHSEEQGVSSLASLRADIMGDRRKQELVMKQMDERLLNLREEIVLRARASDAEFQRISGQTDGLAADVSSQLATVAEKQNNLAGDIQSAIGEMRTRCESLRSDLLASLANKREVTEEAQKRDTALEDLELRLQEHCLQELRKESTLRQSTEDVLKQIVHKQSEVSETSLQAVKTFLSDELECLRASFSATEQQVTFLVGATDVANRRIDETYENCCCAVREEENRRLVGEKKLMASASDGLESMMCKFAEAEIRIAGIVSESASEAERYTTRFNDLTESSQALVAELGSERQQRSIANVGLMTEVSEVRSLMSQEAESQQESVRVLSNLKQAQTQLDQRLQEEEACHFAFSQSMLKETEALRKNSNELQTTFENAMTSGWQNVADKAALGREELWHVLTSLQERTAGFVDELQDMDTRTKHIEIERLGKVSEKLEDVTSSEGHMAAKFDTLEKLTLREQVQLGTRLDTCAHDLLQTRQMVDSLVDAASRDFLESQGSQFRLYINRDGNVAVYKRNTWGKYSGNDFEGIPCWHAGSQPLGDRPLCAVNREMQAHERDRFLGLANRSSETPR